jgi:hypothetical protein
MDRVIPKDELTIKRDGVKGYQLVSDNTIGDFRTVVEAYHDKNEMFCLESHTIKLSTGEVESDGELYFKSVDEIKQLIKSLQHYVQRYSME